jgi:hypothetical protein
MIRTAARDAATVATLASQMKASLSQLRLTIQRSVKPWPRFEHENARDPDAEELKNGFTHKQTWFSRDNRPHEDQAWACPVLGTSDGAEMATGSTDK